jgi:alpha-galactosidase
MHCRTIVCMAYLCLVIVQATSAPSTAASLPTIPIIAENNSGGDTSIRPPYIVGVRPNTPIIWTPAVTGQRPLHFEEDGLPIGVNYDPDSGTITGSIAKPGNYPVTITASGPNGRSTKTVNILIGDVIARTPPMGWNSYDAYGDDVVESEILANAQYIHDHLQQDGYDTVVVDFRWYDPDASAEPNSPWKRPGVFLTMDPYGRLTPSPNRFPSASDGGGFTALADKIHAMGLKFGIHVMRGIPRNAVLLNLPIADSDFHAQDAANTSSTCGWCPDMYGVRGDTPAGQAYYNSIVNLYASWGVDYIKVDDMSAPYSTNEIAAVHNAIEQSGRSIVLSLSPGETPIADADHVVANANLWRLSGDFWDGWRALNHAFDLDTKWHDYRGTGHWPDSDMLPVGHLSIHNRSVGVDRETGFTKAEQVTLLSLWCLQPAPLMIGANLPDNNAWTLALLSNPEVLAIDQDSSPTSAQVVTSQNKLEVWDRPLADGSLAVGFFNRNDDDSQITTNWTDLGLTGKQKIRNLWQRKDIGVYRGSFTANVPAHGAQLYRFTPAK